METIGISEFKAKCIEKMKAVQRTGDPLLVTLRQRPLASIVPYAEGPPKRVLGALRGRLTISGDIVHTDLADEWEMEQ